MNVSIAMTTYNGEKYVQAQLDSILKQLNKNDEVIICDDGSTDYTIKILENYARKNKMIKLHYNKNLGVVRNFEYAISKCKNDIIFLSDQDDLWDIDKVNKIKIMFNDMNELLILHNAINFHDNCDKNDEILITKMEHGLVRNIVKSSYWGCCMAFKKDLINDILPFPVGVIAHDQWIGIVAESKKTSKFIDEPLILHRKHKENVTKNLIINKKISFRINLMISYIKYKMMNFKFKCNKV